MGKESRRNGSSDKAREHGWVHPLREWRTPQQRHDTKVDRLDLGALVFWWIKAGAVKHAGQRPEKFGRVR